MRKFIEIIDAKYTENYKIWVKFNDGKSGIVNLEKELWGSQFEQLKADNQFKNFKISEISKTLEWENGADIAPEFLYNEAIVNTDI